MSEPPPRTGVETVVAKTLEIARLVFGSQHRLVWAL